VLSNLKLTVHVIVLPETLFRLQSYNTFSFRGSAGLSGC
jgi:lysozyme family protein